MGSVSSKFDSILLVHNPIGYVLLRSSKRSLIWFGLISIAIGLGAGLLRPLSTDPEFESVVPILFISYGLICFFFGLTALVPLFIDGSWMLPSSGRYLWYTPGVATLFTLMLFPLISYQVYVVQVTRDPLSEFVSSVWVVDDPIWFAALSAWLALSAMIVVAWSAQLDIRLFILPTGTFIGLATAAAATGFLSGEVRTWPLDGSAFVSSRSLVAALGYLAVGLGLLFAWRCMRLTNWSDVFPYVRFWLILVLPLVVGMSLAPFGDEDRMLFTSGEGSIVEWASLWIIGGQLPWSRWIEARIRPNLPVLPGTVGIRRS